jgi:hypothetical protein
MFINVIVFNVNLVCFKLNKIYEINYCCAVNNFISFALIKPEDNIL